MMYMEELSSGKPAGFWAEGRSRIVELRFQVMLGQRLICERGILQKRVRSHAIRGRVQGRFAILEW